MVLSMPRVSTAPQLLAVLFAPCFEFVGRRSVPLTGLLEGLPDPAVCGHQALFGHLELLQEISRKTWPIFPDSGFVIHRQRKACHVHLPKRAFIVKPAR